MPAPTVADATEDVYGRLEQYRRDADAEQTRPAEVLEVLDVVNMARNPELGVNASGWGISVTTAAGALSRVTPSAGWPDGVTAAARLTITATGSIVAGGMNFLLAAGSLAGHIGETLSARVLVRMVAGAAQRVRIHIDWRDAGGTSLGSSTGANQQYVIPAGGGAPTLIEVEGGVVPPGTDKAYVILYSVTGASGRPWAAGDIYEATALDVRLAAELDGGYVAGTQPGVEWLGAAHASESHRLPVAPVDAGYPLLRFLSLVGDQLDELAELVDRIDYRDESELGTPGDTSDLVNPATADPAWLPWLAQLVGTPLGALDEASQRAAIAGAVGGWRIGNRSAILAAARTALTGTKFAEVLTDPLDPFLLIVRSLTGETPSYAAVAAAIEAARARPAGHQLAAVTYIATVGTLTALRPLVSNYYVAGVPLTVLTVTETR